eukprot:gene8118-8312_t
MRPKPVVICLGDSHTRGVLGASWFTILTERHKQLQFVNAGVDGETSECIKLRLQPLLQQFPDPAAVILFAGSNDNIAMNNAQMQWYYKVCHGSNTCSFPFYEANMRSMLDMLQQQAPSSKVFLISIPPSTEQPFHDANIRISRMQSILQQLILDYPIAELVDYNTACVDYLKAHNKAWKQAAADGSRKAWAEPMHHFNLLSGGWLMATSVMQRYWLHHSWDDISRARGMHLLTDQVHLNDTAAVLLADQLEPLIQHLEIKQQQQQH